MAVLPDPLLAVIELAERRRDAALARVATARTRADEAAARLGSLEQWRRGYHAKAPGRLQATDPARMDAHAAFLARLDAAVVEQGRRHAMADAQATRARADLASEERRLGALRTLLERRAAQARLRDERRQRVLDDEIAARIAARAPLVARF